MSIRYISNFHIDCISFFNCNAHANSCGHSPLLPLLSSHSPLTLSLRALILSVSTREESRVTTASQRSSILRWMLSSSMATAWERFWSSSVAARGALGPWGAKQSSSNPEERSGLPLLAKRWTNSGRSARSGVVNPCHTLQEGTVCSLCQNSGFVGTSGRYWDDDERGEEP